LQHERRHSRVSGRPPGRRRSDAIARTDGDAECGADADDKPNVEAEF
jgi:hypothetical protein